MSERLSRNQVIKAVGAFIAGATAVKLFKDEPAQAQTTFSSLRVTGRTYTGGTPTSTGAITFYSPDGAAWFHLDNGPAGGRPAGRLRISHGGSPGQYEVMSVVQDGDGGRVGIQTTAPLAKLHVTSGTNFDLPHVQITQTNANDFARLRFNAGTRPFWDIAAGGSASNTMNFFVNGPTQRNVMFLYPNGDAQLTGRSFATSFITSSSRKLKESITELSSKEALETLKGLSPIKFSYKADIAKERHIGFIAEDVPELVATSDRKGLSSMDIVAVLTKVVQEQQKTILALVDEVKALKEHKVVS